MTAGAQAAPGPETAATAVPATRRGRVLDVLLLGALSSFAPLSTDMYLPALPGVARELGVGAAAAPIVGVAGPHTLLPMGLVMAVLGCGARLIVPRRRAAQAPAANPST